MKFYLSLVAVFAICQMTVAKSYNITCYYDTFSINRSIANFTENDLKKSLEYCSQVVYGYVGIRSNTFDIQTLHSKQHAQFSQVRKLKNNYRHIKFLLSLGGNKDTDQPNKYTKLIEASNSKQSSFARSAVTFLRKYDFDGLDLAYQFPLDKPQPKKSYVNKAKNFIKKQAKKHLAKKGLGDHKGNDVADRRLKSQFTSLIHELKAALRRDRLMLTLTVMPHVKSTKYIDIPAIMDDLDYVNLGTFDYTTPERNPRKADYFAPIYAPPRHKERLPQANIDHEVRHWLSKHISPKKLNIGIATYGRAWRMTKALKSNSMPITSSLAGPAQDGELTHTAGLLSWPEMCGELSKMSKSKDKKYGNFAYRSADVKGHDGMLITYEDRDSISAKADYVQSQSLGGVAIFDLTMDDFRAKCKDGIFPLLKTIKFKLH